VTLAELRTDIVILSCAISAGIHGALSPDHFEEGIGAGVGFVAATVLLAVLVVDLTLRPTSVLALVGAAGVLAGLIGSYALAVTTGFPLLHPEAEPVDSLALATNSIEVVGLVSAATVIQRPALALTLQPKGT
jgi:hypothetical protein